MTPEDQNPQFTVETAPVKSTEKQDQNERPIVPMNKFINSDQSNQQQINVLQ